MVMKQVNIQLAQYSLLASWRPQVGDFVVQHGWLTHWFGIINGITNGTATIIRAGMPVLLLTMDESEINKNKIQVSVAAIQRSRGGKYAVLQTTGNNSIWYV